MRKAIKISLFSVVPLCVLASWLTFGDRGLIYLHKKDKERQEYLEKIEALKKENQALIEEINRLRSDSEYIEKTARKEYNMIKDGEVIFMFDKDNKSLKQDPGSQTIK